MFFVPLWGPQVALRGLAPVAVEKKETNRPAKFGISDVMILMAFIALANALAANIKSDSVSFNLLFISANALAILVWFRCLRFMKVRNINDPKKRAIMQIFVYPGSVLSVAYVLISTLMLGSFFLNPRNSRGSEAQSYLIVVAIMFFVSLTFVLAIRTIYARFVVNA